MDASDIITRLESIKDSILNYKGKDYFFYHWQNWNGGSKFSRNTCIEYLYYNEDGTIQEIVATEEGVKKVE